MPHRTMYMLAYWSWIWNRAASLRLRLHGARRPVAGDLVCAEHRMAAWDRRADAPMPVRGLHCAYPKYR